MAVDTLGHLLALVVTPGDVGDREEVGRLAREVQEVNGEGMERVVERSFAWLTRFRWWVRDYGRLPKGVAGLPFLAFAVLLLRRLVDLLGKVINTL